MMTHRRKQVRKDNGQPLAEVEGKRLFEEVVCPYADCGVGNFFMSGDNVDIYRLKEVNHVGEC